jgi:dihydropteroate synthase
MSHAASESQSDPQNLLSHRANRWQLRSRVLELGPRPLVMGILNVTPDSFSDGGQFFDHTAAVEHGLRLAAEGADILDVGGESTRPYSAPVPVEDELKRVVRVIRELTSQLSIPISIDTSKAAVARAALDVGAEIINDITALRGGEAMLAVAVQSSAAVCVMHMQGTPQTMQDNPHYDDVVAEVLEFLRARADELTAGGIERARIALDPGIGFGKSHAHNLTLLTHCDRFHTLGCPLLLGHSRKGFIAKQLGDPNVDPTAGTIGVALSLARQGVQILRVHDVLAVRQALLLYEATGGLAHIS